MPKVLFFWTPVNLQGWLGTSCCYCWTFPPWCPPCSVSGSPCWTAWSWLDCRGLRLARSWLDCGGLRLERSWSDCWRFLTCAHDNLLGFPHSPFLGLASNSWNNFSLILCFLMDAICNYLCQFYHIFVKVFYPIRLENNICWKDNSTCNCFQVR